MQRVLKAKIAFLRLGFANLLAGHVSQDHLQPLHQFRFGMTAKLIEVGQGVFVSVVNQVRGVEPTQEARVQLKLAHLQLQKRTVALQAPILRLGHASPYLTRCKRSANDPREQRFFCEKSDI